MNDLAVWRRIRRFAVPPRMIAECAAARARGDWRAACAAADVAVGFASPGRGVEEMVAGLAPDLLRWHLPRTPGGYTTLAPGLTYVLSGDEPVRADTPVLVCRSPSSASGSQRLTLSQAAYGTLAPDDIIHLSPYHGDARRAGELPVREGAWADAGILPQDPRGVLGYLALNPFQVEAEARRLSAVFGMRSSWLWLNSLWPVRLARPDPGAPGRGRRPADPGPGGQDAGGGPHRGVRPGRRERVSLVSRERGTAG